MQTSLQRQLAERLGRTIPLQVIFEEPTTANLVRLLSSGDAASSPVIRFAPRPASDRRPTLVMMPGIFALPFYLRDLAAALQADVDLVSISLPGLPASETPLDSIESQAEFVIANIRRLQPRGPYYIGGHSYGGTVAYEVARRLRNEGEGVPVVILGDTVRTRTDLAAFQTDAVAYTAMVKGLIALYGTAIGRDDSILADGPPREIYDRLAAELAERGIFGPIDLPADRMAAMFMANFRALGRYRPLPMPGDLDLLRTDGGFPAEFLDHEPGDSLEDPALGWSDLVEGQIAIHAIPGDHLSLMAPETLQATAAIIRRLMAAMSQPAGPASA